LNPHALSHETCEFFEKLGNLIYIPENTPMMHAVELGYGLDFPAFSLQDVDNAKKFALG
jgi:hypothetical protein